MIVDASAVELDSTSESNRSKSSPTVFAMNSANIKLIRKPIYALVLTVKLTWLALCNDHTATFKNLF